MTTLKITPTNLTGRIQVPSSKSMGHRAYICAALAGQGQVLGVDESKDMEATRRVLANLGGICDCGESGSTLRFLLPLALVQERQTTFVGQGKLVSRPLQVYYDIFAQQGISYTTGPQGHLPVTVTGKLRNGVFTVPGDVSSQFISGLLFALPLLEGASEIVVTGKLESQSYIALTLSALADFGIKVEHEGYRHYYIAGGQQYKPRDYQVEGDYSQAAFWLVAGTLGSPITCQGLRADSLQGDSAIVPIIRAMGGYLEQDAKTVTVQPRATHGITIDAADCPDLVPVLTVLAALSEGTTHIINAGRLRIKECDRLRAMTNELNKIGGQITELPEGLIIEGRASLHGGVVECWNDHRIAMSLAVAALKCSEPLILRGTECVAKSYPRFWEDYATLGGRYE